MGSHAKFKTYVHLPGEAGASVSVVPGTPSIPEPTEGLNKSQGVTIVEGSAAVRYAEWCHYIPCQ